MSLEKIIKNSISAAVLATVCSGCAPKHLPGISEPLTQETVAYRLAKPVSLNPVYYSSGVWTTILANPLRASEKYVQRAGYVERTFSVPYTGLIHALVRSGEENKPAIIVLPGFLEDRRGPVAKGAMVIFGGTEFTDNTIVILDDLTSAPFVVEKGEPSLCGIEGGYVLEEVAKQIRSLSHPNTIIAFGASMGGHAALHAAYRTEGAVDAVVAISPVISVAAAFASIPYNTTGIRGTVLDVLLKDFLNILHEDTALKDVTLEKETLQDYFMQTQRYDNRAYVEQLFRKYVADGLVPHLPQSNEEYLEFSDADRIAHSLHIPALLISAENDPLVAYSQPAGFQLISDNEHIETIILKKGGHIGFPKNYLRKVMSSYVTYTSPVLHPADSQDN